MTHAQWTRDRTYCGLPTLAVTLIPPGSKRKITCARCARGIEIARAKAEEKRLVAEYMASPPGEALARMAAAAGAKVNHRALLASLKKQNLAK